MKTLDHRYYVIKDIKDIIYFDTQDGTAKPLFPIDADGGWEALTDAIPYNPTAIDYINTLNALRGELSDFPQYKHILGRCIRELEGHLYENQP